MKADGARCVKTFFQRFEGQDLPQPSLTTLRAIVRAAHGAHLPVLVHATGAEAHLVGAVKTITLNSRIDELIRRASCAIKDGIDLKNRVGLNDAALFRYASPAAPRRPTFRIGSLILLLFGLAADETRAASELPQVTDSAYSQPQQLVEIEPHRRLNLYCIGTGTPAVIFDSGLADDIPVWAKVQPDVAKFTRACTYDRAGIGFSDPARRAGTSANIVEDLHRLLRRAFIAPPYIFVGHSYGGLNIVLYADRYPTEVAGMVLIDPTLENQTRRIRKYFPAYDEAFVQPRLKEERSCVEAASAGFVVDTKPWVNCLPQSDPAFSDAINASRFAHAASPASQRATMSEDESIMSGRSGDQLRAARRSFKDIPLMILAVPLGPHPLVSGETQPMQDAINAGRERELQLLANRSTKGIVRFVLNSGHYIQSDQPSKVVDSVVEILGQVR
jgi:pimeloyl-ACP methyl ester carboxylesterase